METVDAILAYLDGQAVWWGLFIVMLAAMTEYIFPPFPGDTVTLVAAVLIPTADWPVAGVFGAVMLGSIFGCAIDWKVGRWFHDHPEGKSFIHRWLRRPNVAKRIETIKSKFRKRGAWFIVSNRFVPAFRGLFFVAAGISGLSFKSIVFWAALSAALWNAAILAAGSAVGYNLDALVRLMEGYSTTFFIVAGIAFALWLAWTLFKRSRDDEPAGDLTE